MTTRPRSLARLLSVGLLFLVPALALAGPNEGGTLILHANPGLVFTSDIQNYCGMSALDSCSAAVTSVDWDPGKKIVFHAIAAFPPGSQPRLKALSFGIDYDPTKFLMVARGTCADFEIPGIDWLGPGTGTSQSWTTGTQTGSLTEVYWFAGYAYSEQTPDSTSVSLIPHPLQHGVFVDDAFPAEVDTIAGYGRLGFGVNGSAPCLAVDAWSSPGENSTSQPDEEEDQPENNGGSAVCCLADGSCQIVTQQNCLGLGGQYLPTIADCGVQLCGFSPSGDAGGEGTSTVPRAVTPLDHPSLFVTRRGRVVSASTNNPIQGAIVVLYRAGDASSGFSAYDGGLPARDILAVLHTIFGHYALSQVPDPNLGDPVRVAVLASGYFPYDALLRDLPGDSARSLGTDVVLEGR